MGNNCSCSSFFPLFSFPIFAECRAERREEDAWIVADSVAWLLLAFGTLIAITLFCFPDMTIRIVAPGVTGSVRASAVYLVKWCGLAFIPLCWTGAACGILYAYDIFYVAALAQLLSNLILALAITFTAPSLGAGCLVLGVLAGAGASTLAYHLGVARLRRRFGPKLRVAIDFNCLRRAFKLAAPLIGNVIAGQSISIVINRALSRLPLGSLAAFGYAWKMSSIAQLLPKCMLSTVVFPKFSATWYSGGRAEFAASCIRAVRAATYIAIPLTALCWALRRPIVAMLFQRGAFTGTDATAAGILFGLLVLNGPAASVTASLNRAFSAVQETRLPVAIEVGGNVIALASIPFLTARFGAVGAAFAYMLIPWATACCLIVCFGRRFGVSPVRSLGGFVGLTLLSGCISVWLGAAAGRLIGSAFANTALSSAGTVIGGAIIAGAIYYTATLYLGFPEARTCSSLIRRIVRMPVHQAR